MSLADELLADLEDGTEDDPQQDDDLEVEDAVPEDVVMGMDPKQATLNSIAKLLDSEQVCRIVVHQF